MQTINIKPTSLVPLPATKHRQIWHRNKSKTKNFSKLRQKEFYNQITPIFVPLHSFPRQVAKWLCAPNTKHKHFKRSFFVVAFFHHLGIVAIHAKNCFQLLYILLLFCVFAKRFKRESFATFFQCLTSLYKVQYSTHRQPKSMFIAS